MALSNQSVLPLPAFFGPRKAAENGFMLLPWDFLIKINIKKPCCVHPVYYTRWTEPSHVPKFEWPANTVKRSISRNRTGWIWCRPTRDTVWSERRPDRRDDGGQPAVPPSDQLSPTTPKSPAQRNSQSHFFTRYHITLSVKFFPSRKS